MWHPRVTVSQLSVSIGSLHIWGLWLYSYKPFWQITSLAVSPTLTVSRSRMIITRSLRVTVTDNGQKIVRIFSARSHSFLTPVWRKLLVCGCYATVSPLFPRGPHRAFWVIELASIILVCSVITVNVSSLPPHSGDWVLMLEYKAGVRMSVLTRPRRIKLCHTPGLRGIWSVTMWHISRPESATRQISSMISILSFFL